ncbi:carbohydrate ABC transporter permease [Kineosporia sp. A_224]|uniref:carbohydrate ABC transporter permease n=1 Tax=Kineosporia sp. A_224 TaxID=1962180 RepID=UPI000B4BDB63|nr:sugar ABC transporter permease [Kineosporia sp. A_224]
MENWESKLTMLVVGIVAFFVVAAAIMFIVDNWPKRLFRDRAQIAWFIGPPVALVTFGLVYPAIRTTMLSFKDPNGESWVGLDNYKWVVTDPDGLLNLRNTAIWVLFTPIISVAIGLVYALLIDKMKREAVAKIFIFLPMAISGVAAAIIWRFVFAYKATRFEQIGLLNAVVKKLGLETQQWLLNPPWNTFLLIMVMIWVQVGFAMVVLSAAIKGIPNDMIEAARLDGVNAWQMFWKVTLPTIRPTVVVVFTTITIGVLKVFDIVRTMTGGNYDTSVIANGMYFYSFSGNQQGWGSALAVVLFVLVTPVVFYQVRQLRRQKLEAR